MEMIILIGLQASGKSTFFQTHFAETHEHISKDLLRNNRQPGRRQAQLVEAALQGQHSVVIDDTNPTVEVREPLIRLGHMYGAEVIGYFFESQVSQCIERNRQRTGKAKMPVVAIYTTAKKLVRPSYAEGFGKLFYVRIANDGTFEVGNWLDEEEH
jgi:predicted kinase